MNEKQFIESQKDCASMLGMNLNEYNSYCKKLKIPSLKKAKNKKYNNDILKSLGLEVTDLKIRREM